MGRYLTSWHRVQWGLVDRQIGKDNNGHWGEVMPNIAELDRRVDEFIKSSVSKGFEIKSVIPLTASTYYGTGLTNSQGFGSTWGGGYGYGCPATVGVMILLQQWVEDDAVVLSNETSVVPA